RAAALPAEVPVVAGARADDRLRIIRLTPARCSAKRPIPISSNRTRNRAVADEVVQDAWLGVIRGTWAFEGRSSLRTWIFRIFINRAKTRAAREGRTVPFARFEAEVEAAEAAVAPDRFRARATIDRACALRRASAGVRRMSRVPRADPPSSSAPTTCARA